MSGDNVSRVEFVALKEDIGDMKTLLQKMVDAMSRLAIIDERQAGFNETAKEILRRMHGIEDRQHKIDVEAAKNGDNTSRLSLLETSVREMHVEREKDKAKQDTMIRMVRWMWAGVPVFTSACVFAVKRGVFG